MTETVRCAGGARGAARLGTVLRGLVLVGVVGSPLAAQDAPLAAQDAPPAPWRALFNGRDLEGWTPKIRGFATGEDPLRTFRVEDGLLTVGYDQYDTFDERFGHLFFETPFSDYDLRVEYRFVGSQARGGPDWATRNSGVMIHSQSPESMGLQQDFPISIEVQLLGGDGEAARPTANLCTPGTHVQMNGQRAEQHCFESTSATYHGPQWVEVDIVVRGGRSIAHVIEGDTVMAYSAPEIGGGVVSGFDPAAKVDGRALTSGWIALQSESHPVQFRRVWIHEIARQ